MTTTLFRFLSPRRLAILATLLLTSIAWSGCILEETEGRAHTPGSVLKEGARTQAPAEQVAFTLEAHITGYKGVGGAIDGQINPELKVKPGSEVTITLINKEAMAHDIGLENAGTKSDAVMKVDETTTFTFVAAASDTYYCTIPGHRQAGMVGKLTVEGAAPAPEMVATANAPTMAHHGGGPAAGFGAALKPAKRVSIDEVGWDASDIPAPLTRTRPEKVEFVIETEEVIAEIEDGTTFELWTYNGKVPGPMLRVMEGDDVVIHLDNHETSLMPHSIDFHAATGPGGGAVYLQVPPGERRSLQFKALKAGLYVYHCATPHIPTHMARGMYGLILVEPPGGLPEVDHEYYVVQGEYYTNARPGTDGHMEEDGERLLDELPTYVLLNGRVGSITGERAMKAEVGDTLRIFFGVGGPNLHSAFHVIGEIFDRVYPEGALLNEPLLNVQTTSVPPGGATMVEFEVDYPGSYLLVDHALSRLDKGAVGILEVSGDADERIFKGLDGLAPAGH